MQEQLKNIALSNETYKKIVGIADKYNLMLDSQGELAAEIRDVIMGYTKAKDFIKNIEERLEIDNITANKIASDVNIEIFEKIIEKLKNTSNSNADIENIVIPPIDKPTLGPSIPPAIKNPHIYDLEKIGQFKVENTNTKIESTQYKETGLDRDTLLRQIEEASEEPYIDHLIETTKNPVENKVQANIPREKQPYTADPYREQI